MLQNAALRRLRAEYLEMPGLGLTLEQVRRLCAIEGALCQAVLDALVDEKFLRITSDGRYTRVSGEAIRRPHPAKADLRSDRSSSKAS